MSIKDDALEKFKDQIFYERLGTEGNAERLVRNNLSFDELDENEQIKLLILFAKKYDFDLSIYSEKEIREILKEYEKLELLGILYESVHSNWGFKEYNKPTETHNEEADIEEKPLGLIEITSNDETESLRDIFLEKSKGITSIIFFTLLFSLFLIYIALWK
jgi:hypothetical protein